MRPSLSENLIYQFVQSGELQVDGHGRVWRLMANNGVAVVAVERRRAEHDAGDYLVVRRMIAGKRISCGAHRLVWRYLNGEIPPDLTINHKNGDKRDNRPDNLELATFSEQAIHARRVLQVGAIDQIGERHPLSKLSTEDVVAIRRRRACGEKLASIAQDFGVCFQAISLVALGKRWVHVEDGR